MKVVLQVISDIQNEVNRVMETVKSTGTIVDNKNGITFTHVNDIDHIYIEYNKLLYKFNRYDQNFIEKVEESIQQDPYKNCRGISYKGNLIIAHVDERFTHPKYYKISKCGAHYIDKLEINTDLIIDDLYNNTLETKSIQML
jgi:hypothetical protein